MKTLNFPIVQGLTHSWEIRKSQVAAAITPPLVQVRAELSAHKSFVSDRSLNLLFVKANRKPQAMETKEVLPTQLREAGILNLKHSDCSSRFSQFFFLVQEKQWKIQHEWKKRKKQTIFFFMFSLWLQDRKQK